MGWPQCNSTEEDLKITEDVLWHGYTFHTIGLWIAAAFTAIAIAVSFFLIFMHATHYLKPWEQRHIIRILFMVPIYAAVSLLSFYYYYHSVYFEVLRDCYEAFAIASFFSLMSAYLAPDLHQQKVYFRTITPKKWVWPMGWLQKCTGGAERGLLRTPRSGLTWFNVIWVCIFQYCFVRVFFTIVAVITQAFDRYCLETLNPAFAHIWVMGFETISITIAMYCLIQFYIQIKGDIAQHKPLLKITAIKLVIFLSFWQTLAISFLTSTGAIKASNRIQTPDIKVGFPAMLLCVEMAFFAIFHIWSFSWKPYTVGSKERMAESIPGEEAGANSYQGGFLGVKAIVDAFNAWDMLKAMGRSVRWLFKGRKTRHHDPSYDMGRKGAEGNDFGTQGQKLSDFDHTPTSYTGTARPPLYAGGDVAEEGDNLLSNSQAMGVSRPPAALGDSDPADFYDPRLGANDIGVATSRYSDNTSSYYLPPSQHGEYQPYQPDSRHGNTDSGQESGVVGVPYPESRVESSRPSRDNRISMPYMPPPRSPDTRPLVRGQGDPGNPGNFI